MKAKPVYCGDCLVLVGDCSCTDYLKEIESSAERLVQLAKEREELSK